MPEKMRLLRKVNLVVENSKRLVLEHVSEVLKSLMPK